MCDGSVASVTEFKVVALFVQVLDLNIVTGQKALFASALEIYEHYIHLKEAFESTTIKFKNDLRFMLELALQQNLKGYSLILFVR